MPVTGQDLVMENIKAFGGGFINHVNATMSEVKAILETKVIENITLRDHSLADLARMGHPYSHGVGGLHEPYYQVHEQTGKLRSSEKGWTDPADVTLGKVTATAYVGLDESIAPHAASVIYGTSKMIPRPVLEGSRDEVIDECTMRIRENLKNLTTSFRGKA